MAYTRQLTPKTGEAFAGYLYRLSTAIPGTTPLDIVADLGLSLRQSGYSNSNDPVYWIGNTLPEHQVQRISARLGLSEQAVRDMQTLRYVPDAPSTFQAAPSTEEQRSWRKWWSTLRRSTRVCPACVDSTGTLQVTWGLAFHFMCLEHSTLLASRCSTCAIRSGPRPLPAFPLIAKHPDMGLCWHNTQAIDGDPAAVPAIVAAQQRILDTAVAASPGTPFYEPLTRQVVQLNRQLRNDRNGPLSRRVHERATATGITYDESFRRRPPFQDPNMYALLAPELDLP